jgi:uncharacterized cupredoxin-like copper-binding protein
VKKSLLAFLIGALPLIALMGCGGTQDQDADSPDAADGTHTMEQQSHDDSGHGHDESAADSAGAPAIVDRDVQITMDDNMRFAPDSLTFKAGETVRFVIQNNGKIPHEFVIGSMSELMEHAEMMRAMPSMQHAEANMLTLAPGAEGELIWSFDETGTVDFACTIPGHLEAGMKGVIQVE